MPQKTSTNKDREKTAGEKTNVQNRFPNDGQKVFDGRQVVAFVGKYRTETFDETVPKNLYLKILCGITGQNNNRTVMLTETVRKIF